MIDLSLPIEFNNGETAAVRVVAAGFNVRMQDGQHPYIDNKRRGNHDGIEYFYSSEGIFGGGSRTEFKYLVNVDNPASFEFDI